MGLLDFFKNIIGNETKGVNEVTTKKNAKQTIYEKMIEVTHTNTEGRQKLIKQLIKNDEFLKGNDYFQDELVCCDMDIEDGEMSSGKKCIKVVVRLDESKYPSQLGYIPENLEDELHEEVKKADGYSVDLYVNTDEDGKYSLKVKIKFYK